MFTIASVDQIVTDHWNAHVHQAISIAYRTSESAQKGTGVSGLPHKLWRFERILREFVEGMYGILESPGPPTIQPVPREKLVGAVRAMNSLYDSIDGLCEALKSLGYMNNSSLAAPLLQLREYGDEVLGFANWLGDIVSDNADARLESSREEFRRGETISLDEALLLGPSN